MECINSAALRTACFSWTHYPCSGRIPSLVISSSLSWAEVLCPFLYWRSSRPVLAKAKRPKSAPSSWSLPHSFSFSSSHIQRYPESNTNSALRPENIPACHQHREKLIYLSNTRIKNIHKPLTDQGLVSQKSRDFWGLFLVPQFPLYLRNTGVLSHPTSQSYWFFLH